MQAHPDPHLGAPRPFVLCERALSFDRCPHGVLRAREREEERVALRVDLAARRRLEGAAQEPPLVGQHLPVVVAELLQQARRALDVGEQERDGAAWESHPVTVQR